MKKKLNGKIDDAPDQEQLTQLKKSMREQEIRHNDAVKAKDEEYRVLKGKMEV